MTLCDEVPPARLCRAGEGLGGVHDNQQPVRRGPR